MWIALTLAALARPPVGPCPEGRLPEASDGVLMPASVDRPEVQGPDLETFVRQFHAALSARWEPRLEALRNGPQFPQAVYRGRMAVMLDSDGAVIHTCMVRSTGEAAIDQAMTDAAWEGSPYGTPPRDLMEPDGRVFLPNIDFTVDRVKPQTPVPSGPAPAHTHSP